MSASCVAAAATCCSYCGKQNPPPPNESRAIRREGHRAISAQLASRVVRACMSVMYLLAAWDIFFYFFLWKPMAAAMACHRSHHGIPREPTLYSTGDHGGPWVPMTVAIGAHGRPRDPTRRPREAITVTTVGCTLYSSGLSWVFQWQHRRSPSGNRRGTSWQPVWELT